MKYRSDTFITVPNKDYLKGMDMKAQVLFLWLCVHSNDDEECFPSRLTLANECGMSKRSVDQAVKMLEDAKLIIKKNRMRGNEKTTNLYTVIIKDPSAKSALPRAGYAPPSAKSAHRTQYTKQTNLNNRPVRYKTRAELGLPQL